MKVKSKAEEGLYNLYFHNCPLPNAQSTPPVAVAIQVKHVYNVYNILIYHMYPARANEMPVISNTRECFITFQNTEKRVEKLYDSQ